MQFFLSSLFSFSRTQNRFHAFMSLCVLTFVFPGFCCKVNSWNSSTFLLFCFHSLWHIRFSRFPTLSIQRPREIFNCLGKDFSEKKLRNRILISRLQRNFSCGTKRVILSGQDSSILFALVANHSARFGSSRSLTEIPIKEYTLNVWSRGKQLVLLYS